MRPTVSPRLQARILFVRECPAFFIASWLPLCLPPPHPQKEADWSCSRGKVTDDERDFQRVGSRARSRPPALFLILFSNLFKNPSVRPLFHRRFSPALGGGGVAESRSCRSGGGVTLWRRGQTLHNVSAVRYRPQNNKQPSTTTDELLVCRTFVSLPSGRSQRGLRIKPTSFLLGGLTDSIQKWKKTFLNDLIYLKEGDTERWAFLKSL